MGGGGRGAFFRLTGDGLGGRGTDLVLAAEVVGVFNFFAKETGGGGGMINRSKGGGIALKSEGGGGIIFLSVSLLLAVDELSDVLDF